MALFSTLMGLFWLFAEGLLMVFVRKGMLFLETGRSRQSAFLLFCLTLFAAIVFLYAGKGPILDRLRIAPGALTNTLYDGYLWNFICTLWVLIEGAIAVYVFRVYRRLKCPEARGPVSGRRFTGLAILILWALFLAGFGCYHGFLGLYLLSGRSSLSASAIVNILRFYIKICGLFWILIEWVVAVIAIKTSLILKGGNHVSRTV
jgi:hypothetical protein